MNYIDLHIHTIYTLGNGITEIKDLVKRAKEYGMTYLAITDSGSIEGFNEFKTICKQNEIKPVFGCGFYFAPLGLEDNTIHHLVLIAKDETGYNNLLNLDKEAKNSKLDNKPRISWDNLEKYNKGLICLTGGLGGVFDKPYLQGNNDLAYDNIKKLHTLFKSDFYLELQDNGQENNLIMKSKIPGVANTLGIEMVVTGGSFYLDPKDSVKCNKIREDNGNKTLKGDSYNFKSPKEIEALFPDFKNEIDRTFLIAKSSKVTII